MEAFQRTAKEVRDAVPGFVDGRDEMNLVEFPLSLLSERAAPGVTTLEFSDEIQDKGITKRRHVSIVASAKYGLPTATDEDVLMGMLQLAKLQNEFSSPVVHFTRLQLIRLLGWENSKWSYDRIATALHRWRTVSVTYTNAWRDNKNKQWQDQGGFGLIDSFNLRDSRKASANGAAEDNEAHSWFRWGGVLFESFRAGYIKKLNYGVYLHLEQQAAKRLYRYLDKHFYEPHRLELEFDLRDLACEHLGMSRAYDSSQIKRHLQPAVEELEQIGFVEKAPMARRYKRVLRGKWSVVFRKKMAEKPGRQELRRLPSIEPRPQAAKQRVDRVEQMQKARVQEYLTGLSKAEREQLEETALGGADHFLRRHYETNKGNGGPLFDECRRLIIQKHVLNLLAKQES